MNATVVVTARERFRPFIPSLKSLFSTIDDEIPVIVVDGGAPAHIRRELAKLQKARSFELIENDRFVLQNKARNMGLDLVKSKYVAFCDNDLEYQPNWLDTMLENAEVNGSAAVAPVTLIGPSDPPVIHHAGGCIEFWRDDEGRLLFKDLHRLDGEKLPDAEAAGFAGASLEHTNFEYHCALLRTEAIRAIGGHDERLILHEYNETSLRMLANDEKLTFEPRARVMYMAFVPFKREDMPFFIHRWSQERAKISDVIFGQNWGIHKDLDGVAGQKYGSMSGKPWVKMHMRRVLETRIPKLPPALDSAITRKLVRAFLRRYYRLELFFLNTHQTDEPDARMLPHPDNDALRRAGFDVGKNTAGEGSQAAA